MPAIQGASFFRAARRARARYFFLSAGHSAMSETA
jgi:hypothetical protein